MLCFLFSLLIAGGYGNFNILPVVPFPQVSLTLHEFGKSNLTSNLFSSKEKMGKEKLTMFYLKTK